VDTHSEHSAAPQPYRPSMSEGHGTDPQPLKREQVASFLARMHDQPVEHLEPLGGGFWSSAWGYQAKGDELVVRFGENKSWYEIDRMAMAFCGPGLPVPTVRDVGIAPDGRAYVISERHRGIFLENIAVEQAAALAPTLTGLLVALHDIPAAPDASVLWHSADAPPISWRQFLMAGLVDEPESVVHGWSATLSADPTLSRLSLRVTVRAQPANATSSARRSDGFR
jgi:aminoglycoside phosphotransferase (APT) family kinase protein